MNATSHFDGKTTTDEVLSGVDLSGKTAFVTGGASGIGQEAARAMAAKGAQVIIAARDPDKGKAAVTQIREGSDSDTVQFIACDLASLESIRHCAREARERYAAIDLQINNAGVMACPLSRTAEGFEMQFGTNHLGHFLLTNLLMPLIESGQNQRIVNLSSRGHHRDQVHFDDPNYSTRDYEKWAAYGQSKTANVLFTVALEARLAGKGIHAYAVHPGVIATNLGRHMTAEDMAMMTKLIEAQSPDTKAGGGLKSIPQGAATTCFAATAPQLEGKGGVYCEDCHVAEINDNNPSGDVKTYAVDPDKAEKLWALSERLVGQEFGY
jgi:NAD(P)-dependent dehydrogenase (short-subunit alcohol dehydrogenase family)